MTFYLLYNQKHDRKSIQISNEESQILWMNQLLRIHGQEVISMNWYLWKRQENRSLFGFWILYQRISKKNKFWEWSSQISRQFDWIYWEENGRATKKNYRSWLRKHEAWIIKYWTQKEAWRECCWSSKRILYLAKLKMNKKINLSNRSINLLKWDNRQWFKWYVLGDWENEFKPYFAIWEAFANCMDYRTKFGEFNTEFVLSNMEKKFKENGATDDEVALASLSVSEALNNFKTLDLPKPIESEKEVIIELNERYNLKVKFDAFYWDYILDHKTVSTFTKPEDALEKYGQQMKLYQFARYKKTGEKLHAYIQEIKKGRASIPKELIKADLIELVPDNLKEATVNDMKDYLRMNPPKEWIGNRIEFAWDDSIIEEIEKLLERAMKKADYLQTLQLDDIL